MDTRRHTTLHLPRREHLAQLLRATMLSAPNSKTNNSVAVFVAQFVSVTAIDMFRVQIQRPPRFGRQKRTGQRLNRVTRCAHIASRLHNIMVAQHRDVTRPAGNAMCNLRLFVACVLLFHPSNNNLVRGGPLFSLCNIMQPGTAHTI